MYTKMKVTSILVFLLLASVIIPGSLNQTLSSHPIDGRVLPTELVELTKGNGTDINERFGWNTTTFPDVDGDGYDELIVGAPGNGITDIGQVYCFPGSVDIAIRTLSSNEESGFTLTGSGSSSTGGEFGWDLEHVDKLAGQGHSGLVIGAPGYEGTRGRVFVTFPPFIGSTIDMDKDLLTGTNPGDRLGHSVSSAGDVDNDGNTDIIVGAPGADKAYLCFGNTWTPNPANWQFSSITVLNGTPGINFGASVHGAGDLNGDGFSDVIVGAPNGKSEAGEAYIFFGNGSWGNLIEATDASVYLRGITPGSHFGSTVFGGIDINLDGYHDVAITESGTGIVKIFYGSDIMYSMRELPILVCDKDGGDTDNGVGLETYVINSLYAVGFQNVTSSQNNWNGLTLSDYDAVFITMGTNSDSGDAWELTTTEQNELRSYLDGGGRLYIESGDLGWNVNNHYANTLFFDYLHANYDSDGGALTGATVSGVAGDAVGGGLVYTYTTETGLGSANSYLSEIAAQVDSDLVFTAGSVGHGVRYHHPTSNYKTIWLTVLLGGLQDGTNTRAQLVQRVMDWFDFPGHANITITSPLAGDGLGNSLSMGGDIDGDGFSDMVIGAPSGYSTSIGEGAFYYFLSSNSLQSSLSVNDLALATYGGESNDHIAFSLSADADLNGDGRLDIVSGSPVAGANGAGEVRVYSSARPPQLNVLYPNGNELLTGSVTIQISAHDGDDDINSSGVSCFFSPDYVNWTYLGSDTIPEGNTYEIQWDTTSVEDGSYYIKALVQDQTYFHREDTSDAPFTVDNPQPPELTVLFPTNGSTVSGFINLRARATDPDMNIMNPGVEFSISPDNITWHFIDSTTQPVLQTVPEYSILFDTLTLPDGHYWVMAKAKDTTSLVGQDTTDGSFKIDNPYPPNVTVVYPNGGEVISGSVELSVQVFDEDDDVIPPGVGFQYSSDRYLWNHIGFTPTPATDGVTYTTFWNTTEVADGQYYMGANVTDNTSLSGNDISNSFFTIDNPDPPHVILEYPAGGENISGTITLRANASDPDGDFAPTGAVFSYSEDGSNWTNIGSIPPLVDIVQGQWYPFQLNWNTDQLAGGDYHVRVEISDLFGLTGMNMTTTPIKLFRRSASPPDVELLYPTGGEVLNGSKWIIARADDIDGDLVPGVLFSYSGNNGLNWTNIGNVTEPTIESMESEGEVEIFKITWNTQDVPNGNYIIMAVSWDEMGHRGYDITGTNITVDNPRSNGPGNGGGNGGIVDDDTESSTGSIIFWLLLGLIIIVIILIVFLLIRKRGKTSEKEEDPPIAKEVQVMPIMEADTLPGPSAKFTMRSSPPQARTIDVDDHPESTRARPVTTLSDGSPPLAKDVQATSQRMDKQELSPPATSRPSPKVRGSGDALVDGPMKPDGDASEPKKETSPGVVAYSLPDVDGKTVVARGSKKSAK